MPSLSHLKKVPRIVALVLAAALPSGAQQPAQQPDDLQTQLQQLKQQYDATTRDLEQRITALEQQIEKEKQKEKEEKEAREKAKDGTISTVELAAQQAARKAAIGGSSEVGAQYQGQLPSEPTYDLLGEADQEITSCRNRCALLNSTAIFVPVMA
jgi:maltoporin